jgi:hypothetical protein
LAGLFGAGEGASWIRWTADARTFEVGRAGASFDEPLLAGVLHELATALGVCGNDVAMCVEQRELETTELFALIARNLQELHARQRIEAGSAFLNVRDAEMNAAGLKLALTGFPVELHSALKVGANGNAFLVVPTKFNTAGLVASIATLAMSFESGRIHLR